MGSSMGQAFTQSFTESFQREYQHQRNLQYQRDMMELMREQILWEMELQETMQERRLR